MEKIYFVLRDEDLFQTWIEQAEKLKFLSMDEPQSKETSAPKQSIAHSSSVLKQDGSDGNSHGSKWDAPTRVNDRSTADHVEKPVESNRQKSANNRDTDNTRHDDARNTDDRDANNTRHNATRNADKDAGQTEEEKNKEKEKRYAINTAELMIFVIFFLRKTLVNSPYFIIENCSIFQYFLLKIVRK